MESPGPWKSPGKLFRPEVLLGDKVSSHLSSMHLTCVLDGWAWFGTPDNGSGHKILGVAQVNS